MEFNLIEEKWIPIRRKSGREEQIAPWEITDFHESDPVISLNAPRPDFNGALIQFLIGLVQTTVPPEDEDEWEERFDAPPSPNKLKAAFESVKHAFNLGGNRGRFMQETGLETNKSSKSHPISYLLIGTPTDNTLKENRDFFVKRDFFTNNINGSGFCMPCAAAALFTLQAFAPGGGGGGEGKFTSLRGGGPLSTVILGKTLWQTIWVNTLKRPELEDTKNLSLEYTFPWLKPEKFIETNTKTSISSDLMNPLHVYWNMPRRIFLEIKDNSDHEKCVLCGNFCSAHISHFYDATSGMHYSSGKGSNKLSTWIKPLHPLTPYSFDKKGRPFPRIQREDITYRHWLGLIQKDKGKNQVPAYVTHVYYKEDRSQCLSDNSLRLWAFGYDMDNMKARCWYESTMPLLPFGKEIREEYEQHIANLIIAAKEVADNLKVSVKHALFCKVRNIKKNGELVWSIPEQIKKDDKTAFEQLADKFWQQTESDFYTSLKGLKIALEDDHDNLTIRRDWHKLICRTSLSLFDEVAWNGPIEDADPKRVVLARHELERKNNSKKIREELLDLPKIS